MYTGNVMYTELISKLLGVGIYVDHWNFVRKIKVSRNVFFFFFDIFTIKLIEPILINFILIYDQKHLITNNNVDNKIKNYYLLV